MAETFIADFPANYTNALVVGTNICGTFTSLLSIITTVAFPSNYKTVALIYFSISLATLVLCGVSLIYVTRLKFYKFYVRKGELSRIAEHSTRPSLRQFYETFKGVRITILLNSFAAVYDVGSRGPQGTEKSFPVIPNRFYSCSFAKLALYFSAGCNYSVYFWYSSSRSPCFPPYSQVLRLIEKGNPGTAPFQRTCIPASQHSSTSISSQQSAHQPLISYNS
ncbi:nucleoside transporter [Cooperia oncophora]